MNCRPGDLAIFVRSMAGNEGRIVRCLKMVGSVTFAIKGPSDDVWEVDPPIRGIFGDVHPWVPDENLRPIRDDDGQDETLTWAPVPEKVTT